MHPDDATFNLRSNEPNSKEALLSTGNELKDKRSDATYHAVLLVDNKKSVHDTLPRAFLEGHTA